MWKCQNCGFLQRLNYKCKKCGKKFPQDVQASKIKRKEHIAEEFKGR